MSTPRRRVIWALGILSLLCGCSGGSRALSGNTLPQVEGRSLARNVPATFNPIKLYVGADDAVFRYSMFHGIPKNKPDMALQNVGGPVAASPPDGRSNVVYALNWRGIAAFADGNAVPSREIILPVLRGQSRYWLVLGMAVDRDGYLYVGVQQQKGGRSHHEPDLPKPPQAVFIYRPHAHGLAQPMQVIRNIRGNFEGLALDAKGELFVLSEPHLFSGLCQIIADPRTRPHLVGSFTSDVLGKTYGVTEAGDDLYVSTFVSDPYRYAVAVFPISSRGDVLPERSISATQGTITGPLAEFDGTLFVGSINNDNKMWFFDGDKSGPQVPIGAKYFENGVSGVAVGQ